MAHLIKWDVANNTSDLFFFFFFYSCLRSVFKTDSFYVLFVQPEQRQSIYPRQLSLNYEEVNIKSIIKKPVLNHSSGVASGMEVLVGPVLCSKLNTYLMEM